MAYMYMYIVCMYMYQAVHVEISVGSAEHEIPKLWGRNHMYMYVYTTSILSVCTQCTYVHVHDVYAHILYMCTCTEYMYTIRMSNFPGR